MRNDALDHIVCPHCLARLKLTVPVYEGDHAMSGQLVCSGCSSSYPILHGVPRLIPSGTHQQDLATGHEYKDYFAVVAPSGSAGNDSLYGKGLQEEIDDFLAKVRICEECSLSGRLVLDAGCGMARIAGYLAQSAKTVVAFDITPAVYDAFTSWRDLPNVHIVQADLAHIPAPAHHFDLVWCDGALPYVTDIGQALRELSRVRSTDGLLYSWCFSGRPRIGTGVIILLGRFFHAIRFPLRFRLKLIRAITATMLAILSIFSLRNRLGATEQIAQSILDLSLSHHVNMITESSMRRLLKDDDHVELDPRDSVIHIRIGRMPERPRSDR